MREEIKTILKMIEEGKITAEEGEMLLSQLSNQETSQKKSVNKSKQIHVEVTTETNEKLVKVNIPLLLAKTVLKMGLIEKQITMNAPGIELDIDEIIRMIESDVAGELVNVEADGKKVRVWID